MTTGTGSPAASAPTTSAVAPTGASVPASGTPSAPVTGTAPATPSTQPQGTPKQQEAIRVAWKKQQLLEAIQAAGEAEDVDVAPLIKGYRHKAKVDGQETEFTFDELVRHAGLSRVARAEITKSRKKEAEIKAQRDALEAIAQKMLDPRTSEPILIRNWGGRERAYEWAKDFVAREEAYRNMPPEERQRFDRMTRAQQEAQRRDMELRRREERIQQAEAAERKRRRDYTIAKAHREWPQAMAQMGLPNEPRLVKEAVGSALRLLDEAAQNRIHMTVAEAQREAVEDILARARAIFGGVDPTTLRSVIGDEGLQKAAEANLAKVQDQPGRTMPQTQPRGENGKFESPKKIRMRDFD